MPILSRNLKSKRVLYSRITLAVLAFFTIAFLYGLFGIVGKSKEASRNKALSSKEYSLLEKQKEDLERNLDKIKTPEGVEENIRDKFQGAKEGEGLIVVVNNESPISIPEGANSKGFFDFFRRLFRR